MGNTPNPMNRSTLSRAAIVGVVLAIGGILLFLGLWVVLGQMGTSAAPRLFVSLCIPPAVIGVIIGVYVLVFRSRSSR